ncbi:MAG: VOC family protein [Alphaproteobacteria bacterium]
MIDHISIPVDDVERSRLFYDAVLGALGVNRMMDIEIDEAITSGYGVHEGEPPFWIGQGKDAEQPPVDTPEGQHIAFSAATRAAVDAFYEAGMENGGVDNGAPGLRPHYHENYYAAFLLDPDGHRVEAVCHLPE